MNGKVKKCVFLTMLAVITLVLFGCPSPSDGKNVVKKKKTGTELTYDVEGNLISKT